MLMKADENEVTDCLLDETIDDQRAVIGVERKETERVR